MHKCRIFFSFDHMHGTWCQPRASQQPPCRSAQNAFLSWSELFASTWKVSSLSHKVMGSSGNVLFLAFLLIFY